MTESDQLAGLRDIYLPAIVAAVQREYPNALRHTMSADDDWDVPRKLHPAFYGCFDWHSAVEMHWAIIRLIRSATAEQADAGPRGATNNRPGNDSAGHPATNDPPGNDIGEAIAVLDRHLTPAALHAETHYFEAHPAWERPYGWAWALTLSDELDDWATATANTPFGERVARWAAAVAPLAARLAELMTAWLGKLDYPTRDGAHQNSAFALARSLSYARRRHPELAAAIADAAHRWFGADTDYPARYEPGGGDFLSGALTEAELMAAVLPTQAFTSWFATFLPDASALYSPAVVADATDGQGAHLHGLNLYRAFAFGRLADLLGPAAIDARRAHLDASLPAVVGGHWMAEHWLAAYAVLALD